MGLKVCIHDIKNTSTTNLKGADIVAKLFIWTLAFQEDYHLLYKGIESICDESTSSADRDSGISNCNNFPATMPASRVTDSSLNKVSNANSTANNIKNEATTTM